MRVFFNANSGEQTRLSFWSYIGNDLLSRRLRSSAMKRELIVRRFPFAKGEISTSMGSSSVESSRKFSAKSIDILQRWLVASQESLLLVSLLPAFVQNVRLACLCPFSIDNDLFSFKINIRKKRDSKRNREREREELVGFGLCMCVCVFLKNTKGTQNDNDDNEDKAEEKE